MYKHSYLKIVRSGLDKKEYIKQEYQNLCSYLIPPLKYPNEFFFCATFQDEFRH
jgi:hypothetical protein